MSSPTLWHLGESPSQDQSIATVDYVKSLEAQSLSSDSIKLAIKERFGLAAYASAVWADSVINNTTPGEAFARTSQLQAAAANRIPVLAANAISRANGPVALDSSGLVDQSLISLTNNPNRQTFPILYLSPPSYPVLNSITAETNITTVVVNPALSSYRVFVTGTVNARTDADGVFPQIRIRAGGGTPTSGVIVAHGYGVGEKYKTGVGSRFNNAGAYIYDIPDWCSKIDVVLLGGGGGGLNGGILNGEGGGPGEFTVATLTKGGNLASGIYSLNGTVGAGGTTSNSIVFPSNRPRGGSTTCVIPNVPIGEAQGGRAGDAGTGNTSGVSPAPYTYGGITYVGGAAAPLNAPGNPPGGGGGGGRNNNAPGVGAPGAAFFYAYTNDDYNYGQINVIPTSFENQSTPLSGPTTLYINALRSGSSTSITTSALNPHISVMVVPA